MKRIAWMTATAMLLLSATFFPATADAQSGAVVQALPPEAAVGRLNNNLAKLSRSPQDVEALLGAAQAALDLGDVQAANGFFTRANLVNPNLPAAKLGLAVVELALKQPQEAAANFDAAERLGASAETYLADRGLAYDLTGQQAKAQRDYQAALRAKSGDTKARIRYAVSLGISGKLAEADQMLEPVLRAGDREAWRFRAFIYAMNGKIAEARKITQSVMPKGLADALDPYMVRTPLLTPEQKAAAAHYGDFPANVLRMTAPREQVAVAAAPSPPPPPPVVEPARKDDGKKSRNSRDRDKNPAPVAVAVAPPSTPAAAPSRIDLIPPPPPPPEPVQVARADPPPVRPLVSNAPSATARAPIVQPLPQPPARVVAPPVRSTTVPPSAPPPSRPFVQPAPSQSSPSQPASSQPKAAPERTLASALSSLTVPDAERSTGAAAVDLNAVAKAKADKARKDAEAKAKAEKEAKAKAEAELKKKLKDNPSRIWVQIAAGKNESALAFDLRRFRKTYADAIGEEGGWSADWGATNRLLIGPYKKEENAKKVVSAIKKSGGDAFVWESEAGEEVRKIGAK
ncbi:MAG: SPOR domain-containing protein [Sphingobium sp.]|nr:SPOR domain-containing protein [Sphingobium sp.]